MGDVTSGYQEVDVSDYEDTSSSDSSSENISTTDSVEDDDSTGTPTETGKRTSWFEWGHYDVPFEQYAERTKRYGNDEYYDREGDGYHYLKMGDGYTIADTTSTGYKLDYHANKSYYKFHEGGLVDTATLQSNEVFAKLLKGEFVATPAQMDKFMSQTLPAMVGYTGDGGVNYNAPLISIECGSVTKGALPELKEIVDEAVSKIQKQINSGLSRSGYKRTMNKFSV